MNELDGENKLVFGGPFSASLANERKTEVEADKFVIVSKNGSVAQILVNRVKAVKQMVLERYLGLVQKEITVCGAEKALQGNAIIIATDLYWLTKETELKQRVLPIGEKGPSIQELIERAMKT